MTLDPVKLRQCFRMLVVKFKGIESLVVLLVNLLYLCKDLLSFATSFAGPCWSNNRVQLCFLLFMFFLSLGLHTSVYPVIAL